jgi:hypothetical protein
MTSVPKGATICGLTPAQFRALPAKEQERLKAIEHERVTEWQKKEKGQ